MATSATDTLPCWPAQAVSVDQASALVSDRAIDWCSGTERMNARQWVQDAHEAWAAELADFTRRRRVEPRANTVSLYQGPFASHVSLADAVRHYAGGLPVCALSDATAFGQRAVECREVEALLSAPPLYGVLWIGSLGSDPDPAIGRMLSELGQRADHCQVLLVDGPWSRELFPRGKVIKAGRSIPDPTLTRQLRAFFANPLGLRGHDDDPSRFSWTKRTLHAWPADEDNPMPYRVGPQDLSPLSRSTLDGKPDLLEFDDPHGLEFINSDWVRLAAMLSDLP